MMVILGLVSVACITAIAYIMSTAATIGFIEIIGIAVFGFGAAVTMLAFATLAMAKYTGHKVKTGFNNFRGSIKRLKK